MLLLPISLILSAHATPLRGPDFNGDGYEDSAVSAPGASMNGDPETGMVLMMYGSSGGLRHAQGHTDQLDLSVAGAGAPQADDAHFGESIAWGDFDDDCYDDLVVSIPEPGGNADNALVAVYRGGPTGPDPSQPLFIGPAVPPGELTAGGFGRSVAVGDFNGDGRDDLAIGTPLGDGQVQVHYGGSDALPSAVFDETHPILAARDAEVIHTFPNGESSGGMEALGESLTTGDFNCDGYDDLAMGSLYGPVVAYGGTAGLDGSNAWPLALFVTDESPGLTDIDVRFVYMTSGNFDGNTSGGRACDDLAGVTYALSSNATATVLYGTAASGLQAVSPAIDSTSPSELGLGINGFAPALTAGQFTSDGYEDLAMATATTRDVVLLRGGANGLKTGSPTIWSRGQELPGSGPSLGHGLGAGNYDGDTSGQHDIVLGVPQSNLGSLFRAGIIFTVDMAPTVLPSFGDFDAFTAEDLGSVANDRDLLGAHSLPARRRIACPVKGGGWEGTVGFDGGGDSGGPIFTD